MINADSAFKLNKTRGSHFISEAKFQDMLIDDKDEIIVGGEFNRHKFDGIEQQQPGLTTGFVWKPDIELDDNNDDPVNALQKQSGHAGKSVIYPNPANNTSKQHCRSRHLIRMLPSTA